ncbi:MAG TPA: chemotaxis protein CheW [Burkholderiaceae bacterium]|nr:chemotaxis protein CheW [Burkholderiaceae bacterium]
MDLTQFYQVFFEEAGENLASMEQMLLSLDLTSANDEELNAVFRCAHSVKGGAATFGFADVAQLTHQMETLLDKLRRHEIEPQPRMVDVLLAAGDALKAQLARHQGAGGEAVDTRTLIADITRLASGDAAATAGDPATTRTTRSAAPSADTAGSAAPEPGASPGAERKLELTVGPLPDPAVADNLLDLFKEIAELGVMERLDAGQSADGMRRFKILTKSSDSDLLDLFTFHVPREALKLGPLTRGYGFHKGNPGAPTEEQLANERGYGFFSDAPGAPSTTEPAPLSSPEAPVRNEPARASAVAKPAEKAGTLESTTLRVSVDKVDQLINLVGELVITQAVLAQTSAQLDANQHQQLTAGLADLQRNTRDLQEAVMSIRMIPMSVVFNRYPRMLRDLAARLGKKVELVTQGEATELDKGLVEKITDPLTHLVRNSCDHGIELAQERIAKGKSAHGTITLAASHQGGSILIEVRDDGRGLSRAKLLTKARERGIDAADSLSDAEVWALIFAPGFSTADEVTDISGRGVGMDVVKRNIAALNGSVEIDSAEGYGMSVKVRLPLTLAIMDGMSIGVGEECYILPLSSVVESFQVEPAMIRTVGVANRVVQVREEYLPVIDLESVFSVPRSGGAAGNGIMVIVEAEGSRVAVLVDELLGQQQVVVKNLESNYRKVANVSGATIMGDGRVALILDVSALVRLSRH